MPLNRTSCRQGGQADARRSKERVGSRSTREFLNRYLGAVRKVYGKLGGKPSVRNLAAAERSARAKIRNRQGALHKLTREPKIDEYALAFLSSADLETPLVIIPETRTVPKLGEANRH